MNLSWTYLDVFFDHVKFEELRKFKSTKKKNSNLKCFFRKFYINTWFHSNQSRNLLYLMNQWKIFSVIIVFFHLTSVILFTSLTIWSCHNDTTCKRKHDSLQHLDGQNIYFSIFISLFATFIKTVEHYYIKVKSSMVACSF